METRDHSVSTFYDYVWESLDCSECYRIHMIKGRATRNDQKTHGKEKENKRGTDMNIKKNNGPHMNLCNQTAGAHESFFAYSAPTVVCAPTVHEVLRGTLFIKSACFFLANACSIDGTTD